MTNDTQVLRKWIRKLAFRKLALWIRISSDDAKRLNHFTVGVCQLISWSEPNVQSAEAKRAGLKNGDTRKVVLRQDSQEWPIDPNSAYRLNLPEGTYAAQIAAAEDIQERDHELPFSRKLKIKIETKVQ